MARVKRGVTAHRRHKKVLKQAKGYFGMKSKIFRPANQQVMKSLAYSYAHRKRRKRDFRRLWIQRINAAARIEGMSYSRFISGLKSSGIDVNRKMLADMAVNDREGFSALVKVAKEGLSA